MDLPPFKSRRWLELLLEAIVLLLRIVLKLF